MSENDYSGLMSGFDLMGSNSKKYICIAYRQDKQPLWVFVFDDDTAEHARLVVIELLPSWHILKAMGVTEVWLVTKELNMDTWPTCHRAGCSMRACLRLCSPFCYPHTVAITGPTFK